MIKYLVHSPVREIEPNIYSSVEYSIKATYDRKARLYELLVGNFLYNKIMWGTRPGDYVHYAKEVLSTCQGSVVDIGCGGLIQTSSLYAARPAFTVLADLSLEMLRIGKHRLLQHRSRLPHHVTFLQADAFGLPFHDGAVDNVVSFGMLHLFDNKTAFIKEFLRILKKGGSFHITSLTNDRSFSRAYIRFLQRNNEFATAMSSTEIIGLFLAQDCRIQHYTIGSMVFISGIK
ncbi:class I SAM-dependent methyltransferase [Terrimonas sp. NA20]|uniref:Class I SAM-dependent methyltransferase n=1 Tax=Terrimonas ginsenosidimutans TaxID=2908004 RepID=A0ABS9KZS7_9BACT|nr:class I SAM-dependent methyltransferase [Terrimonas ginsenosidimutans]MCG2617856.1 class I SAM-dependent methyltransferase [Terrimonas ginsenosidimutans]